LADRIHDFDSDTAKHMNQRGMGAVCRADGSVCWRVWAARARQVELVLLDGSRRRVARMAPLGHGYFEHVEPGVAEGQRYAYRLDGGPERPDPMSLWQPEGVHQPSAVLDPDRFTWHDQGWRGLPRDELIFYELHVGTFTPAGTFDAAIERLDELKELGITAVELLPVAQFPGSRGWGYDGVHLFAPQNSYGGPHGLARLVDACHARGLAIFLDVVYNHLGPEGNYLAEFGPYFADRYRTFWGPAPNFDSAGCDAVRQFVTDNVRLWLEDYHFDGLRLDAVHAIFDSSPRHILWEIEEAAEEVSARRGRRLHIVAESNLNDIRLLRPPEQGGYGLAAQWADDFHHVVHTHLTGERQGYYEDFGESRDFVKVLNETFVYDGKYSRHRQRRHGAAAGGLPGDRFVVCVQNHDQVGNRARGDRLGTLVDPPRQRLAASLLLLSPYLPLLFMGEEYGEENPFLFFCSFTDERLIESVRRGRKEEFAAFAWQGEVPDPQAEATYAASRLSWSWPDGSPRAGLRRLYQDLLTARRQWPALRDFHLRAARLWPGEEQPAVLELVRGGRAHQPGRTLLALFNLTAAPQPAPHHAAPGERPLFSSEANRYQGVGRVEADTLSPWECRVFGPADWLELGR
jgi:maltooligosyltrehalose trehalohydrolase